MTTVSVEQVAQTLATINNPNCAWSDMPDWERELHTDMAYAAIRIIERASVRSQFAAVQVQQ
jgi:hypothetical protein